ncbi:MAG: YdcF family protein [Myxococcales bacterium]|nr:YdcF family protein [Myxococcales bacterium]
MQLADRRLWLWAAALPAGAPVALLIDRWMSRRARQQTFAAAIDVPQAHAALVLGARVGDPEAPLPCLVDRLTAGLELWQQGRVSVIAVSGDDGQLRQDEVTPMARWLRANGVPADHILVDGGAYRTLDSVVRARHRLELQSVVLCTQADHLPRALYLASAVGLPATGLVADRRVYKDWLRSRVYETASRAMAVADVRLRGELARQRQRASAARDDVEQS